MDIETIANKLQPLLPDKVKHWMRVRETGDTQLKRLVESKILHTAAEVLGDYKHEPLLSLPPQHLSKGQLNIGTIIYEKEKWPFGISTGELLQNLAIFGRSGAGKTNVAFHILEQLSNMGVPFIFLDWKRTGRHLLPLLKKKVNIYTPGRSLAPMAFNPLLPPPGMESQIYLQQFVDVLGDAYTLGDGAKSLLQKALAKLYKFSLSPTITQLIDELDLLVTKERASGWKISAKRALESLLYACPILSGKQTQAEMAKKLLTESSIVELNGLSQNSKKFLIPMLCLWLYHVKLSERNREKLSLVILLEEAHHVLYGVERRNENLMEQLLRQCRELGISMIIVDQHPHLISSAALGNSYTSVCLNLKDPKDIAKASKLSLLDDSERHHFSQLPVGQGIIKLQDRWHRPFLVQFPLLTISKGSITDEILKDYLGRRSTHSALKSPIKQTANGFGHFRMPDILINEGAIALLNDITANPNDGVAERYKRLRFSAYKGNRLKDSLLAAEILEAQYVPIGQTRKLLLRPTTKTRKELGLGTKDLTHESLTHEYWKRFYADLFQKKGYEVTLEAPRRNGRVDVLAVKAAESGENASECVAVEIETGKSDTVWNVKQDLLMGWQVLVVATDRAALRSIEKRLAQAGLLGNPQVAVVLRFEVSYLDRILK